MSGANSVSRTTTAVSRYDLILAVIPIAILSSAFLGRFLAIDPPAGLAFGAIVGVLTLVDAILINPPRGPRLGEETA